MKKHFITGLMILLPLAITLMIVRFLMNLLTGPFLGIFSYLFATFHIFQNDFLFLSAAQVQTFISQLLILVLLFFFTILLGILARWFFIHSLLRFGDYLFHKIPIIRTIYKTVQDLIKAVFTSSSTSFKSVVLVPFPNEKVLSLGLVTKETEEWVSVFVASTPNPTSGFVMFYQKKELIYLDMTVEEAFKHLLSFGVTATDLRKRVKDVQSKTEP